MSSRGPTTSSKPKYHPGRATSRAGCVGAWRAVCLLAESRQPDNRGLRLSPGAAGAAGAEAAAGGGGASEPPAPSPQLRGASRPAVTGTEGSCGSLC